MSSLNTNVVVNPQEVRQSAELGFSWLLDSGIQDQSRDTNYQGGVYAWFDLRDESYPFIYSEITGYAVNAFLFIRHFLGDEDGLLAAQQAADWLLGHRYSETPLVQTRLRQKGFQTSYFENWTFTFDQWIIVYGLAELYRESQDARYLDEARAIADFLLQHTRKEDGTFFPIFNHETGKAEEKLDKWSRQPGSFHAKALMALEALASQSEDVQYREKAHELAVATLRWQQQDGRFITQDSDQSTHLHPHLYTIEGLLSFGLSSGDMRYIQSAVKGWQWIERHRNEDGGIHAFYKTDAFLPFTRVDVLAQTLRVGTVLKHHKILSDIDETLQGLAQKVLSFQITRGLQQGGFLYGQEENGSVHYHVNAWVSMFAAQALWIYSENASPYDMSFFV